jgi:hypothetical protein
LKQSGLGKHFCPRWLALFSKDIEEQWPVSIREIIIATLLRRYYKEFIYIMEQHPVELYKDNSRHALVHTVNRACALQRFPTKRLIIGAKKFGTDFWHQQLHGSTN